MNICAGGRKTAMPERLVCDYIGDRLELGLDVPGRHNQADENYSLKYRWDRLDNAEIDAGERRLRQLGTDVTKSHGSAINHVYFRDYASIDPEEGAWEMFDSYIAGAPFAFRVGLKAYAKAKGLLTTPARKRRQDDRIAFATWVSTIQSTTFTIIRSLAKEAVNSPHQKADVEAGEAADMVLHDLADSPDEFDRFGRVSGVRGEDEYRFLIDAVAHAMAVQPGLESPVRLTHIIEAGQPRIVWPRQSNNATPPRVIDISAKSD